MLAVRQDDAGRGGLRDRQVLDVPLEASVSVLLDVIETVIVGALVVAAFAGCCGLVVGLAYLLLWVSFWLLVVPAAIWLLWLVGMAVSEL